MLHYDSSFDLCLKKRMQSNQFDCILKSVHLWVAHEKFIRFKIN